MINLEKIYNKIGIWLGYRNAQETYFKNTSNIDTNSGEYVPSSCMYLIMIAINRKINNNKMLLKLDGVTIDNTSHGDWEVEVRRVYNEHKSDNHINNGTNI